MNICTLYTSYEALVIVVVVGCPNNDIHVWTTIHDTVGEYKGVPLPPQVSRFLLMPQFLELISDMLNFF